MTTSTSHGGTGRLLTRAEVADQLHVSERTVRRLGSAGRLDEIRVSDRAVRVTKESVKRHLAEGRIDRSTVGGST